MRDGFISSRKVKEIKHLQVFIDYASTKKSGCKRPSGKNLLVFFCYFLFGALLK